MYPYWIVKHSSLINIETIYVSMVENFQWYLIKNIGIVFEVYSVLYYICNQSTVEHQLQHWKKFLSWQKWTLYEFKKINVSQCLKRYFSFPSS